MLLSTRECQGKKKKKVIYKKYNPIGIGCLGRRGGYTEASGKMTFTHADKTFPGSSRV